MKNKNLYDKTVAILVKAYLNDTLEKSNCYACAVGNLVASNMGIKFKKELGRVMWGNHVSGNLHRWNEVFTTLSGCQQNSNPLNYKGEAKKQIDSTGYSWEDLAKIEYAFETKGRDMFSGLLAVVEVLGEIHSVSQEITEETKLLFAK